MSDSFRKACRYDCELDHGWRYVRTDPGYKKRARRMARARMKQKCFYEVQGFFDDAHDELQEYLAEMQHYESDYDSSWQEQEAWEEFIDSYYPEEDYYPEEGYYYVWDDDYFDPWV